MIFVILFTAIAAVVFIVAPQFAKLRATLGIKAASAAAPTLWAKLKLQIFGLGPPALSTLAMAWSFVLTESENLGGVAWEKIVSHEHAVWIAGSLWMASLWAHFTTTNIAAATPPVLTPLPGAIAAPPAPAVPTILKP